ncbi:MAG: TonB family protein [Pseudomonadota bacterium]
MNYAAQSRRLNPAAMLAALGVPGLLGAVLIAGLAVHHVIIKPIVNPTGGNIPDIVEITPEIIEPESPPSRSNNSSKANPEFSTARPEIPTTFDTGTFELPTQPKTLVFISPTWPNEADLTELNTLPPFLDPDPIPATPRGNPADWISTSDYRTVWINRGFAGTARFTLQIDASGRVSDCAITGSTGYEALDGATCRLLKRRARFAPARNGAGDKVAGTYSSAVTWQIP